MQHSEKSPSRGDATGSGNCSLLDGVKNPHLDETPPTIQASSHEIARILRREEVHEAAAEAMNYLGAIMHFVAADDVPGLRYSYAKFAAYGRVVALGCKALAAPDIGGAR